MFKRKATHHQRTGTVFRCSSGSSTERERERQTHRQTHSSAPLALDTKRRMWCGVDNGDGDKVIVRMFAYGDEVGTNQGTDVHSMGTCISCGP